MLELGAGRESTICLFSIIISYMLVNSHPSQVYIYIYNI